MITTDSFKQQPLPAGLYSAAEVRALDSTVIDRFGVAGFALMQRAGAAALGRLLRRWPLARSLVILCGSGNNGGDGYVIAGLARQQGLSVECIAVGDPGRLRGDARSAWALALEQGVQPALWSDLTPDAVDRALADADVLVDALLGTGLEGEVRAPYDAAIAAVNRAGRPVMAVDTPSGLSSDSGRVLGVAVRATLTVTFIGLKRGLLTGAAPDYTGELAFDDLSVNPEVYEQVPCSAARLDWSLVSGAVPRRAPASHKGRYGRVLVIGGDHGMGGAAMLAAEAAARSGAGLVYLATRPAHVAAALTRCPEVMVHGVDHGNDLVPLLADKDVVVVGPGLGRDGWGQQMLQQVLDRQGPCVLDADALNLLSVSGQALRRDDWVLTPHPGEAARLLGTTTDAIGEERFAAALELQRLWGGTVVLKGAGTLVQGLAGVPRVATVGNPGMATGGMGDVLSGILGGLLAQADLRNQAVELGVCLHGEAADCAARTKGHMGLLARDLIGMIPALLGEAEGLVEPEG